MTARSDPVREVAYAELSFGQQRLWVIDRIAGATAAYTIPLAYRIRAKIDVTALQQALAELVTRHEILRTTFFVVQGQPYQAISTSTHFDLPILDLRGSPDPESKARQIASERASEPFNLETGPLFQALLLVLAPDDHVLVITMHHIIADGWSMGVLESELVTLYTAFNRGEPSPLDPLPFQYADFAAWQRSRMSDKALQEELAFWRAQLKGAPYYLDLLTDHPRPKVPSFEGGKRVFRLGSDIRMGLQNISKRTGATLFMITLAAFQALLGKYAQTEDVMVGIPVAGRTRPELEELIGFFVNALVLRTSLAGDPSFLELVGRARETTLDAFDHQELPFERLVEEIAPPRNLGYNPLAQVGFQVIHAPVKRERQPGDFVLSKFPLSVRPTARFDLELQVTSSGGNVSGGVFYDRSLFEDRSIERLVSRFLHLLRIGVANPSTRLSQFDLLEEHERRMILQSWNKTARVPPAGSLLDSVFAASRKAPHKVALRCGTVSLSYGELTGGIESVAAHLENVGIGPERVVGLLMSRSANLALALLGILESGGCALYLDPELPRERLEFMLANSEPTVILADNDALPRLSRARLISISEMVRTQHPRTNRRNVIRAHGRTPAYTIYTSGTTGEPKGVVVERQSFLNHCRAVIDTFSITSEDVVLQLASFSFDPSLAQLITPLMCGAQVILRDEDQWSPEETWGVINESNITAISLTPSQFGELMKNRPNSMGKLRLIVLGGERLDPDIAAGWLNALGPGVIELWNAYGPTEATISSTWERVTGGPRTAGSIGKPITNVRVYVLDPNQQLSPPGIPGELYIGGLAVARGYQGQPGLTASRFVPDQFGDPGGRLYRSGDRALWTHDGRIRFLGRLDNQVKIRGVRVELSEVEHKLLQHPKLANAIVTMGVNESHQPPEPILSAHIVPEQSSDSPTAHELRQFLRVFLPDAAVPTRFVQIDEVPLTPSGHVDRDALAVLGRSLVRGDRVPPRDWVETELKRVWSQLLGVDDFGIFDDFFDLGGHSLLVPKILAQISDHLNVSLPLQAVFEAPTIAQMAEAIRTTNIGVTKDPVLPEGIVKLATSGKTRRAVLVHGIDGTLTPYATISRQLQRSFDVYGIAPSVDRLPLSGQSITATAREYVEKIKSSLPSDPDVVVGWSMGGVLAHEMVHHLPDVRLLVLIDAPGPENWSTSKPQEAAAALATTIMARGDIMADRQSLLRESLEAILVDHLIALSRFRPSHWFGQALIVISSITNNMSSGGQWSKWVSSPKTMVLDADHYSLLDEPYARQICDAATDLFQATA